MPTPQRLPIVNSDDGVWGDILRQYLLKEHYDDGTDNAVNGGHKTITIRAGTSGAGTAPLKFTSGTLMSSAEAGAIEYNGGFYMTLSGNARTEIVGADTTQTLTNKTLTSPKISSIIDANGNTALTLGAISSAVNNVYIDNQPTGGGPTIGSTGSDTNVDLALTTKGTGVLFVIRGNGHSTVQAGGGYNSGNVNLELNSQGTGVVRANGNPVITTSTAIPNVTGTPSSSTYLRGDGTWATISAGSSTFADNVFTLQDNSDATKQAQFELSGITTGTTRTLTVPNASTTLVGTDATQTLTNKTISGASNTLTNIGLASLSATGTASSATYLRGDNTWATPYTTSYTANVGDGTSTSIVITHNLGTRNVVVNLYDATTYQQVNCDIYRTSTNTITLTFAVAPATNAYVCVVANGSLSTTLNSTDITDSTATGRSVLTAASATAARSAISAISATSTDTLSNKTLDNSNVATVKDTNFTLQDDGDATKQLKFQLSGITTATTRTLTVPDASTTLVGIDTTQTLTNKTISATSNTISGITSSGTYASRPSASAVASGSMYFCTDIDTVYVSNGSVWNYLSIAGKSSNGAMGDPKSTGLSNTTLGSATFTADRGTRVLSVPSNGSDVLRGEHWALSPTSNYTATFYLDFQVPNGGYTRHGVYLLESSSSKLIMLTLNNQGSFYISAERWNNFTSPTASFVGQFNLASGVSGSDDSFPHWFRIRDDGTNRYMEISFNGHEWVQILSEARTTFITPDYIGWGGDINNGSITSKVRLRSFYIG